PVRGSHRVWTGLNQSTGDSYTRRSRHVEIIRLHGLPSVPMPCGLYMDPPGMSRHGGVAEEQRQMHAYIRLLDESLRNFRALMISARARLIDLSASEALSHSRIWARRSALSPHHSHTLASCGKIPVLHHFFTPFFLGASLAFSTLLTLFCP